MIHKYRVWDKNKKRMLGIRALQFKSKTFELCSILADRASKEEPTTCFSNETYAMEHKDIESDKFENCILMQSSGIIDLAGNLIFEGDILECDYDDFFDPQGNNYPTNKKYRFIYEGKNFGDFPDLPNNVTIIGDIHRNPEIVEAIK